MTQRKLEIGSFSVSVLPSVPRVILLVSDCPKKLTVKPHAGLLTSVSGSFFHRLSYIPSLGTQLDFQSSAVEFIHSTMLVAYKMESIAPTKVCAVIRIFW